MTREQAKQNLINIGVSEPTDEQVTNYLNQINGETKREKDRADKYKAEADEIVELRKQLEEKENQTLTDIEKANKDLEKSNGRIAELEGQIKVMNLKAGLAEQGIVGEKADKLIESINNGNFDASILGEIIAERETKAKTDKEQELLDGTPDPDGSQNNGNDNSDDAFLKSIGQNMVGTSKTSDDIVSQYT